VPKKVAAARRIAAKGRRLLARYQRNEEGVAVFGCRNEDRRSERCGDRLLSDDQARRGRS
jgi:hypothetical protein